MLLGQQGISRVHYPAKTTQAAGILNGVRTEVMAITFTDKIMVTIAQGGRLAQWVRQQISFSFAVVDLAVKVQVPLESSNPNQVDHHISADSNEDSLLPLPYLTPLTLLGGADSSREMMGRLYSTQIASAIANRNPGDTRTVVLGLGLSKVEADRDTFFDILELVLRCI